MKTAIINTQIYDFETYIADGYVIFSNTIEQVGPMAKFRNDNYHIIDAKHALLMPGLVCGHTHIYSAFARGMSVLFNPRNFQDILDQLWWKLDAQLDNEATYYSGIVAGSSFALHGVTTLIDHHASGAQISGSLESLKTALDEVGLRAAYAFESSDRFPLDETIEENINFINRHNDHFTKGLFGMHASMSLSNQSLAKIKARLGQTPIHIHVAESQMDQEDCLNKYHQRVIERLDSFELINEGSIIVHGIYLNDHELDIIKKRKAVIAVNVSSNMNNAVGLPDILRFLDKGIPVIIGNDGIAMSMCSEYLTTYYAMQHRYQQPTTFTLKHLQQLIDATYEYASGLLNVKLGRIKPGFAADLLLNTYIAPTPIDETNGFGHLFFGLLDGFKPSDVFIGGHPVVTNSQLNHHQLNQKIANASKVAKRIWNKINHKE